MLMLNCLDDIIHLAVTRCMYKNTNKFEEKIISSSYEM